MTASGRSAMGNAARTRARSQARSAARAGANGRTGSARQKIAASRAADRRARLRGRVLLASGSVAVVIALVATLIAVKLGHSPARNGSAPGPGTTAQVQRQVTSVPPATFDEVGAGTATGFEAVSGRPAHTAGGKPEVLYIGGQYCPFCAAERWALAAAVSRFGTLSGLGLIHSSPSDA